MKRYWGQTNMKLNKKQQESIIDSLDINELPDELLDAVSGGRETKFAELLMAEVAFAKMKQEEPEIFISKKKALNNYLSYIDSLPEGSDTVLFDYEKFKVE